MISLLASIVGFVLASSIIIFVVWAVLSFCTLCILSITLPADQHDTPFGKIFIVVIFLSLTYLLIRLF